MKTFYITLKSHEGQHELIDVRETDIGWIADVKLVGALLPFSVPISDLVHPEA